MFRSLLACFLVGATLAVTAITAEACDPSYSYNRGYNYNHGYNYNYYPSHTYSYPTNYNYGYYNGYNYPVGSLATPYVNYVSAYPNSTYSTTTTSYSSINGTVQTQPSLTNPTSATATASSPLKIAKEQIKEVAEIVQWLQSMGQPQQPQPATQPSDDTLPRTKPKATTNSYGTALNDDVDVPTVLVGGVRTIPATNVVAGLPRVRVGVNNALRIATFPFLPRVYPIRPVSVGIVNGCNTGINTGFYNPGFVNPGVTYVRQFPQQVQVISDNVGLGCDNQTSLSYGYSNNTGVDYGYTNGYGANQFQVGNGGCCNNATTIVPRLTGTGCQTTGIVGLPRVAQTCRQVPIQAALFAGYRNGLGVRGY